MAYRIVLSSEAERHLRFLTARQQATVVAAMRKQLMHQPTVETRNRKLMEPNPLASWELRVGNLRVYYQVEEEPEAVVQIVAIGVKDRNRVTIGGEVVDL
jgi:mRNA-degrading endonuclease RelE of RelBE toxin-antitoxin system